MIKKFLGLMTLASLLVVWGADVANANGPAQLKIITDPQTVDVNVTSSIITVETQDDSGVPADATSTTYVNLVSDSVTGVFSSKSVSECGADWTKTSVTIASSTAHKSFCYKDSASGVHLITVSDSVGVLSSDSQLITINSPTITLESIAIASPATKLSYLVDETLDISGLIIIGAYSDTSTSTLPVTLADVTGFDSSIATSSQILTITLEGQIATYTIEITAPPVSVGESTSPIIETVPNYSSHSSGYVLGWRPNGQIDETAQVLGASTTQAKELIRQKRIRHIKKRFNLLRVEFYDLKHSQTIPVPIIPATNDPKPTTTISTTTPPSNPFWKFW